MLCGEIVLGGETINDTGTEILSNSTIIQCQLWTHCREDGPWQLDLVLKMLGLLHLTWMTLSCLHW